MTSESIDIETTKVLGRCLLNSFDSKEYVDWAVKLGSLGYDSESMWILAGLDNESKEEREEYFWKAVKELDLSVSRPKKGNLIDYAVYVTNAVLQNFITSREGVNEMFEIFIASGYETKYMSFY